MSESAAEPTSEPDDFDPELLDLMIGAKGDAEIIDLRCQSLMGALCPALEAAFDTGAGVRLVTRPGSTHQGRRRHILGESGQDAVYCEAEIAGWSQEIAALCDTKLIIALVECLLGGSDPDELDVVTRPLSGIELDMSMVVFEQLIASVRGLVFQGGNSKFKLSKPQSTVPAEEDDPTPDFHAAAITIDLEFGALTAPLTLLLPQSLLLKTKFLTANGAARPNGKKGEWAERLSEQVSRSQIELQAAVAMQPLQLSEISRLQPGDLIGFADSNNIEVTLSANGKQLYTCALGKSGSLYMVKIEKPVGPDEDWRSDFS